MKLFLSFVKKELFHIFRDVKTLLILFGLPVALILIFANTGINSRIKTVKPNKTTCPPIAVVENGNTSSESVV